MSIEHTVPAVELYAGELRLRPWQPDDAENLRDVVQASLSSVGRWLPWCHADYGLEDASGWIAHCQHGWSHDEHFAFAVFDDRTGELVGGAGLNQRNHLHRSANLGYWVRQSRQGEGIAARAASRVARFGFESLELIRIEIVTLPNNLASRRTAEKIGAKFEAVARHRLWVRDQATDAAVHALIRADMNGMVQPSVAHTPATSA